MMFLILSIGDVQGEDATIAFTFPVPSPNSLTVTVGSTVTWTGASSFHPLEQVTGPSSDTATAGGFTANSSPFSKTFDTAGTFYYRCTNHGVAAQNGTMRGSIVVQEAASATPTVDPESTPTTECSTKPSSVTLTSPTKGQSIKKTKASLNWDDEECATTYRVTVKKGKKSGKTVDQKTVTKSSYKTITLAKGSAYFWSVKACNTVGCSSTATSNFTISK